MLWYVESDIAQPKTISNRNFTVYFGKHICDINTKHAYFQRAFKWTQTNRFS